MIIIIFHVIWAVFALALLFAAISLGARFVRTLLNMRRN